MGKSPARWIKTVLFGKKHSKTNASKTVTADKKSAPKKLVENPAGNFPVISDPIQFTDRGAETIELEKGTAASPCDANISSYVDQGVDAQSDILPAQVSDVEMKMEEEAATKAQAAFRGYLARRAFRALKGIIRLQALIRGHLVRRQAVATLRCMHAIVRIQALARGRKVRLLDGGAEVHKKFNVGELQGFEQVDIGAKSFFGSEKLATNAFAHKLLVALPNAMSLSLQYDSAEPNSAWNWLERWSLFHFWVPPPRTKKIPSAKPQRKQVGESEAGKSKRTFRKVSAAANGDSGALPSSELDKPKRASRKVTSHQTDSVQELPQNELERVKRSLRKVSASAAAASEKPVTESEKPSANQNTKKPESEKPSASPDFYEQQTVIVADSTAVSEVAAETPAALEDPSKLMVDELVTLPCDDNPAMETHCSENGEKMENSLTFADELGSKEEQCGKENQKMRKRRSLPAKQEYAENISQNTPSLPSYMAATESAKAKLRAQGSSKFGEDSAEQGFVRRHSLPASTNGKLSSLSPRIQKPVQANGKGAGKPNRALTSSRDDKVLPGWRR